MTGSGKKIPVPEERALEITPEQAEMLVIAGGELQRVRAHFNAIAGAVMAGHGIRRATVIEVEGTTLKVLVTPTSD